MLCHLINCSAAWYVTLTQLGAKMNNDQSNNNNLVALSFIRSVVRLFSSLLMILCQFFLTFFFFCRIPHFICLLSFLIRKHTEFFVQMKKAGGVIVFSFVSLFVSHLYCTSISTASKPFLLCIYCMSTLVSLSLRLTLGIGAFFIFACFACIVKAVVLLSGHAE